MSFTLNKIEKGITTDIAKKNYSLDKYGISNWLIYNRLMQKYEILHEFRDIQPWTRTGCETYSTIFEFTTDNQIQKIFVKSLVTINPERSLIDWTKRRNLLNKNNVPVSKWFFIESATLFEQYYPNTIDVIKRYE